MQTTVAFLRHVGLLTFLFAAICGPATALGQEAEGNRPEQPGGINDKPYLTTIGQGAVLGGYMDMEFEWDENNNTFDQHRFVPFITGHVSERVTVSAEIEFEHGGNVDGDGEIKLEYAVMDFAFSEGLNFRGGVILSPLGSFNLLHDSPLNDLTSRPVVSRQIIPSTLSEAGMGLFGTLYPGEEAVLSYQAFLVNGFDGGIIQEVEDDGGNVIDGRLRIRGGRGSQKKDNNNDKAIVARAGFSPVLGSSVGLSVHSGKYDDAGNHRVTIGALDAKVTFGSIEFLGEYALAAADIDYEKYPTAAESQSGLYAQANYHLLHDVFLNGSVVTLVARGDRVDFDTDHDGDTEQGFTLGANFRPTEETVFKFDYNWTWVTPLDGERGDAENRFFFSFATYF
ncbi:MAG: hypothetical protein ABFS42_06345 [Candidatus Krumholzibacteriota bacterium]